MPDLDTHSARALKFEKQFFTSGDLKMPRQDILRVSLPAVGGPYDENLDQLRRFPLPRA